MQKISKNCKKHQPQNQLKKDLKAQLTTLKPSGKNIEKKVMQKVVDFLSISENRKLGALGILISVSNLRRNENEEGSIEQLMMQSN